jgi:hypothetical protein
MPDHRETPEELRARGFTDEEIEKIARIASEGVPFPTRDVVYLEPISDPLIAFYWARLDERAAAAAPDDAIAAVIAEHDAASPSIDMLVGREVERALRRSGLVPSRREILADVAAKKAILDDYATTMRVRDELSAKFRAAPAEGKSPRDLATWERADYEATILRTVIKQLATVYEGHPDYDAAWKP